MISGFSILAAFKKNCPNVRMTREEEDELVRLINLVKKEAHMFGRTETKREAALRMINEGKLV